MLDYMRELDADFRTFYHYPPDPSAPGILEEEFGSFSGPRFLSLAWRTASYQGAVAAKVFMEKKKEEDQKKPRTVRSQGEVREASLTQVMGEDPDLIEYERV